jgi:hypothetical protein
VNRHPGASLAEGDRRAEAAERFPISEVDGPPRGVEQGGLGSLPDHPGEMVRAGTRLRQISPDRREGLAQGEERLVGLAAAR